MATKKETRQARRARLAAARSAAVKNPEPAGAAPAGPRSNLFSRRQALAGLALALMVGIGFFPALEAGFIWDDVAFSEEPVVHQVSGLRDIWFSPGSIRNEGHYWPLTYTSFWLEHKLWGLAPIGYHLVNVLLYLGNVLLLWRLCRRLSLPGAWAVAAIWALHPLHVESVVWTIEQKDVLSGLFYLGSALAYLRLAETGRWGRYGVSLSLYALGLLAKSAAVTLPAALLIWHWWQRGRITRQDVMRTVPFFLVGLAVALADTAFYRTREVLSLDFSLVERILIAARALWFYAGKLLWRTDLAVIYPLWEIRTGDPLAWLCVAGAVALPVALWLGRGRWGRGPLACVAFFAATLSPALGLIDYGYMQISFVADRFQYLAGIGLLTLVVAGLIRTADRLPTAWTTRQSLVAGRRAGRAR